MKIQSKILLNVLMAGATLALVSCGGGGSGSGPAPAPKPLPTCSNSNLATINMGDMTVVCTDGTCSLIKLQWFVSGGTILPSKIDYVINSNAGQVKTDNISGLPATSGYILDGATSTPLALGPAANSPYTITFTSTFTIGTAAPCTTTATATIRAASSVAK